MIETAMRKAPFVQLVFDRTLEAAFQEGVDPRDLFRLILFRFRGRDPIVGLPGFKRDTPIEVTSDPKRRTTASRHRREQRQKNSSPTNHFTSTA